MGGWGNVVGGDKGKNTDEARVVALLDRGTNGHTVTGMGAGEGGALQLTLTGEKKTSLVVSL